MSAVARTELGERNPSRSMLRGYAHAARARIDYMGDAQRHSFDPRVFDPCPKAYLSLVMLG